VKYKAAMFDLDGTLLYTLKDIGDSMNRVLKKLGYPAFSLEDYKYLVGDGGRNLARKVLPTDKRNDENTETLLNLYKDEMDMHWADSTHPYEGIPEMLQGLYKLGVKLTVLSNKSDDLTQKVMKRFLPEVRFDLIQGARSDFPLKPDPKAAIAIAAELGIAEGEFLYVGDTATDMLTANAAGMYPIGVLWGFRLYDELKSNGAKLIAGHPLEIVDFCKSCI
jgi:phosphoglycolate phosphatase